MFNIIIINAPTIKVIWTHKTLITYVTNKTMKIKNKIVESIEITERTYFNLGLVLSIKLIKFSSAFFRYVSLSNFSLVNNSFTSISKTLHNDKI